MTTTTTTTTTTPMMMMMMLLLSLSAAVAANVWIAQCSVLQLREGAKVKNLIIVIICPPLSGAECWEILVELWWWWWCPQSYTELRMPIFSSSHSWTSEQNSNFPSVQFSSSSRSRSLLCADEDYKGVRKIYSRLSVNLISTLWSWCWWCWGWWQWLSELALKKNS